MSCPETVVALHPHPAQPSGPVSALTVALQWDADGALRLRYTLTGALDAVRWPALAGAAPARCDNLWRRTCLEAFVAPKVERRYHEFNFSPAGDFAAYAFVDVRQRQAAADPAFATPPPIRLSRQGDIATLETRLPASALPGSGPWQLNLSAVLEDTAGGISYWALAHPAAQPDFHARAAFVLELSPPLLTL